MKSLYLVSTLEKSKKDEYKFGRYGNTEKKLLSRYRTYLINPICYYFKFVNNYIVLENKILSLLDDYRLPDENGKKTEWVKLELSKIIPVIDKSIKLYDDKIYNNKSKNKSIKSYDDKIYNNKSKNKPFKGNTMHICERCDKIFYNRAHLEDHLNRKIPCIPTDTKNKNPVNKNYCEKCNKYFKRPYTLNRHIDTIHNNDNEIQNNAISNVKTNKNDTNQINTGSNNKFVIKQYNLLPFGKDGIDCLTTLEKIEIFFSEENPLKMIIEKVNLDPLKLNHHNVGYIDIHSGYGIIFDGDQWIIERIEVILEILLESKEKDLLKIYDELKDFLLDHANDNCKCVLNDINKIINPRNKIDAAAKRIFIGYLKKHLYNNRNLAIDAKKNTKIKTGINNHKNKSRNVLKEEYIAKDVDKQIKLKNENLQKINLKKRLAIDILEKLEDFDDNEYQLLADKINKITDINVIKVVIRLLNRTYYSNEKINEKVIQHEIDKDNVINKLLFD
jgi:hypothetical protein